MISLRLIILIKKVSKNSPRRTRLHFSFPHQVESSSVAEDSFVLLSITTDVIIFYSQNNGEYNYTQNQHRHLFDRLLYLLKINHNEN
jgi:hypothetical protein